MTTSLRPTFWAFWVFTLLPADIFRLSAFPFVLDLVERVETFKHESEGKLRLESLSCAHRNEIHQMVGWASAE